jgi:hypothetical protein
MPNEEPLKHKKNNQFRISGVHSPAHVDIKDYNFSFVL